LKVHPSTIHWRNFKTQQSPVIMNLCIRRSRSVKSRDPPDVIVFEKLRFQNVFSRPYENEKPGFSNFFGFEERFRKAHSSDDFALGFRENPNPNPKELCFGLRSYLNFAS